MASAQRLGLGKLLARVSDDATRLLITQIRTNRFFDGSFFFPLFGIGAKKGLSVSISVFSIGIYLNVSCKSFAFLNVIIPEHAQKLAELGAGELLVTSMDGDGTQAGYDLALIREIADCVNVPVVASGGVGTLDHLVEGVTLGHASAVLAASIFHFGTYSISEAHAALRAALACAARIMTAAMVVLISFRIGFA